MHSSKITYIFSIAIGLGCLSFHAVAVHFVAKNIS